ncbi:MAG: hypothetical protein ACE5IG_07580 [Dehalococcoidia bacterium]
MPTIRLTDTAWLDREVERVRGVLLARLPRGGVDQATLRQGLEEHGMGPYTNAEAAAIRNALVSDGTIEIIP